MFVDGSQSVPGTLCPIHARARHAQPLTRDGTRAPELHYYMERGGLFLSYPIREWKPGLGERECMDTWGKEEGNHCNVDLLPFFSHLPPRSEKEFSKSLSA